MKGSMRIDLADFKFAAIAAGLTALPLAYIFGELWNPHGSSGPILLKYLGLIGIGPLVYIAEILASRIGLMGVILACIAQYFWFVLWALSLRLLWRARARKQVCSNNSVESH
jgi:hypothetical protein